jgi:hypothetical protein
MPYVSYEDYVNNYKATVMKFNGFNWVTVGSAGFSAGGVNYITMAIDSSNTPYVAYQDAGNGFRATVMKFNGANWVLVGNAGFSAGEVTFTSIAIDRSNIPYVVYQDIENRVRTTVMKFDGTSWVTVGNPGFSPSSASDTVIALDKNKTPYIAYHDVDKNVIVMKYTGTNWDTVGCPIGSQTQTIPGYVLKILADEARIIRSLRLFFCQTLQEVSAAKYMSPEKKVNIAKELIGAASQKEAALAAVIEAVGKFRDEPDIPGSCSSQS